MNRSFLVPLVVATGLFMENMDQTVIATSLPAIARDLTVDPVILKLAFTSYLLGLAVFIPASGWAADRFGARIVFQTAMAVFTLGSIGCGLSDTLPALISYRAVQGIGGAMMVPVGRLIILRVVPKHQFLEAITYLTLPALVGPVIGPPLGGFITTYFHWRWIFWINVPACALGITMAALYLPEVKEEHPAAFDLKGFVLSGMGLSLLLFGLTLLGRSQAPRGDIALLIGVGAVFAWLYWRHARVTRNPVLDLSLLRIPTFQTGVLGGALFRIGIGAVPFLLPLMLQLGFGLDAFQSGLLTFAAAAGAMFMKAAAQPILNRFGFRPILVWNSLVSSLFLGLCALFTPSTPHIVILGVLLVGGFLRSLQFTGLNAISFADIEPRRMSSATSLSSVAQQVSISLGVATAAAVLEMLRSGRGETALTISDFSPGFIVVALISALSSAVHARLPLDAGVGLIARREEKAARPAE
jgi:EmrB/QacA subfamily drug resistance transporter